MGKFNVSMQSSPVVGTFPGVSYTFGEHKSKGKGVYSTNFDPVVTGDSMYDALYSANPYNNLSYRKSGWQSFLESIGFRTDYDRWLEDAQVNANEYNAQVASIQQQNEYNSPSEQAFRMRQAGLNPDLLGTQGVSDSASPVQDVNGMPSNVGDEASQAYSMVQNFASGILGLFQSGIALGKDLLTYRQMSQAVASGDVDMAKDFMSFVNDYVASSAPPEPFTSDREYREYLDNLGDNLVNVLPRQLHLNRRQRKIWSSVVSPTYFGSEGFKRMTSNWLSTRKNLDDASKVKSYHFTRPVLGTDSWNAFNVVADELGELNNEVWKITQKRFKAVAEKDISGAAAEKQISDAQLGFRDEQTGLNYGQVKVASEGASMMTDYYTNSVKRAMNRSLQRITNRLEQDANDGDLLSAGLLLSFNIFRLSNFKF